MHICNVRSQVFFPGVWVCLRDFIYFLFFFGSLEREPSLWENTWPWEILRTWESFPGIRLGNQDLWGGEKESTFDTGRRVETGTYHWEGRKPFIQTFDVLFILYIYVYIKQQYMYIYAPLYKPSYFACCETRRYSRIWLRLWFDDPQPGSSLWWDFFPAATFDANGPNRLSIPGSVAMAQTSCSWVNYLITCWGF